MSRNTISYHLVAGITLIALVVLSCNVGGQAVQGPTVAVVLPANTEPSAPTVETPVPSTDTPVPIVHALLPGEPPGGFESQIRDTDTSGLASQHRANAGENYTFNLFERPFDQSMNTYFPDLDIKNAALNRDATWVYVTITLTGQRQGGGLLGIYAAELDLNVDGRGDWLIAASAPQTSWSSDRLRVWQDSNHDVGGVHPIQSDPPPQKGDGFETLVDDEGKGADPDAAFARISPKDANSVQLAFKRSLINDDGHFLWGAWAVDQGMFHPDWFDYDDHFTQDEAGSPLVELTKYYPLKALYQVDDTCRWAVGFTPTGSELGICPVPPTPTPILPGTISGLVYYDWDLSSAYNNPPDYPIPSATVRVRSGDCTSPGSVVGTTSTNGSGLYSISVDAGTYCVDVSPDPAIGFNQKSPAVTVTVSSGGHGHADFYYRTYLY